MKHDANSRLTASEHIWYFYVVIVYNVVGLNLFKTPRRFTTRRVVEKLGTSCIQYTAFPKDCDKNISEGVIRYIYLFLIIFIRGTQILGIHYIFKTINSAMKCKTIQLHEYNIKAYKSTLHTILPKNTGPFRYTRHTHTLYTYTTDPPGIYKYIYCKSSHQWVIFHFGGWNRCGCRWEPTVPRKTI